MIQERIMDPTIRFPSYQEGDPAPLERVWVGWKVTALAFQVRAERQKLQNATFWEAMSWWWWEEHVSIPEEERMAAELERLFVEEERNAIPSNNLVFTTGGIGLGTSTPSQRLTITSNGASGLSTVSPTTRLHIGTSSNARSVGSWEAEGIRIDSETHPNFLRKIIVHALLGIKWTPIIPTPAAPTRKSSQSHYARLSML
jgi:hypothetical protein